MYFLNQHFTSVVNLNQVKRPQTLVHYSLPIAELSFTDESLDTRIAPEKPALEEFDMIR